MLPKPKAPVQRVGEGSGPSAPARTLGSCEDSGPGGSVTPVALAFTYPLLSEDLKWVVVTEFLRNIKHLSDSQAHRFHTQLIILASKRTAGELLW